MRVADAADAAGAGALILVVDDDPASVRLLEALLGSTGYRVVSAGLGEDGLRAVTTYHPDLLLLDLRLPDIDGLRVCQRLREDPATAALPVIMLTASGNSERLAALEAGADDFVPKPFQKEELLARVRSLLRIKRYHDTIQAQAHELSRWNAELEARVDNQLAELERLGRLRRFLSPAVADLVTSAEEEDLFATHRCEIAVLFGDLRGFVAFTRSAEPEEVMMVLAELHDAVGGVVGKHAATVGDLTGDGMMLFFGDPVPCADPAERAVAAALDLRAAVEELVPVWKARGHDLALGQGIALGFATLGIMGFEGRMEYGAVGTVVNLAARLCAEAGRGEILLDPKARSATEDVITAVPVEHLVLKGFSEPVTGWRLTSDGHEVARPGDGAGAASATDDDDSAGPVGPEQDLTFRRDGEYWTITYEGTTVRLRDMKGLHYLSRLLREPGREFHVADLGGSPDASLHAGTLLDERAREDYRRRIAELRAELDQADDWGDDERAARAQAELDLLTRELSAAFGLGGRARVAADPVERVRKAVTNRIRDGITKIERVHPTLGRHLDRSIRTGIFCRYLPETGEQWHF